MFSVGKLMNDFGKASFPTPLSPVTKTVMSVGETRLLFQLPV